ncbi:MAG TPA: DegT/DnrJ/EryC1/StrS family aminotransferase [Casimicrobiaceae bacterium]|nr:DegT/DnrJ/EryC1/StrS family aminotransferase [Casimicrobiaceae bacterium]
MIPLIDLRRLHEPCADELRKALGSVLDSGTFVLGRECTRFEAAFAAWCGARHAVGVGNGTDAIEIALRALGIGASDAVATVANAGGYATTAIVACGATPVFVDVDDGTCNVDVAALGAAIAHGVRAVVLTHLYGRLAAAEAVAKLCVDAGIYLVEDCAQAHGATLRDRRAGTFGAAGCFSFYPTKNLGALGDGGAIVTNDAAIADKVRRLRQYGWQAKYQSVDAGGRNSRLDELQAAVLSAKLPYVDAQNARRREIARCYTERISNPAIAVPARAGGSDVVHLFVVRSRHRDALAAHLRHAGVHTDVHYPVPDHRQPVFGARFATTKLPLTERLADEVLTLPCHPAMTDDEVSHVIAACTAFTA